MPLSASLLHVQFALGGLLQVAKMAWQQDTCLEPQAQADIKHQLLHYCLLPMPQFALGGLLQVAEMAWQQDMDLYSSHQYALVAALELHARIIMANDNETLLPQGFKLLKSMPQPPTGCVWAFDMQRQLFFAKNRTSGAWVSDLNDGIKYLQGEMRD
jgi:hypothetical protein